ncbi:class I SAM-dependent methyltransferase [Streptomyces sp. NPDC000345]|uniref:class I SAM-dependent methyltransferase n=1 Tax=Streptomyces sp. NPDC000345 TaxID=3364537 RepID=UPI0036A20EBC
MAGSREPICHQAPSGPGNLYATRPPWDIGRPQTPLLALAEAGAIRGRVLDAGCGTGEHVLMCADVGLDAIDLASNALTTAQRKARERGHEARFLRHDTLRLADLGESFDTVLDCGLFHIFDGADRAAYVDSLRSVAKPGGRQVEWSDTDGTAAARMHWYCAPRRPTRKIYRGSRTSSAARFSRRDPLTVTLERVEAPVAQSAEAGGEASTPTGVRSAGR